MSACTRFSHHLRILIQVALTLALSLVVGNARASMPALPDLIGLKVTGPSLSNSIAQVERGKWFSVHLDIKNIGDGDCPLVRFIVKLSLSKDKTIDMNDPTMAEVELYHTDMSLEAGGDNSWSLGFSVPNDFDLGPYYLGATIDVKQAIIEENESNNVIVSENQVEIIPMKAPDLVPTEVTFKLAAGDVVLTGGYIEKNTNYSARFTIKNTGSLDSPSFTINETHPVLQFYLSKDKGVTSDDVQLKKLNLLSSIKIGGSYSVTSGGWSIPESLPDGIYYFGIAVDPTNVIIELSETNNTAVSVQPYRIGKMPDLVCGISSVKLATGHTPEQGLDGEEVKGLRINYNIDNIGNSSATASSLPRIKFLLSNDKVYQASDKVLADIWFLLPIDAGSSYDTSTFIQYDTDLLPKKYYILALTDSGSIVQEWDESNNKCASGEGALQISSVKEVQPKLP